MGKVEPEPKIDNFGSATLLNTNIKRTTAGTRYRYEVPIIEWPPFQKISCLKLSLLTYMDTSTGADNLPSLPVIHLPTEYRHIVHRLKKSF